MKTGTIGLDIGGRRVGPGEPVYVVAEMSANHSGDYRQAVAILKAAKEAGADAVKIQTYTPDTMTIPHGGEGFTIGKGTIWEGRNLYDLYKEAFTPWEWHRGLRDEAAAMGLGFFSTAFDETAVDLLEDLGVPVHKVASFEIVDLPLIRRMAATGKPLIISTGMSTQAEIREAVDTARAAGAGNILLLKCTSAYPAPAAEMNLRTIPELAAAFGVPAGLSDHTLGHTVAVAAVALGACMVEKHFTVSRALKGPDSEFSMEPPEFAEMVRGIRMAEAALGTVKFGTGGAEESSKVFRRSLYVVKDVKQGEILDARNVRAIRPGFGMHTRHLGEILGRKAARDVAVGTPLDWSMVAGEGSRVPGGRADGGIGHMTERELIELAADRPALAPDMLWSSRLYGIGKWLKRYAGYPDDMPICAEIDHAPHFTTAPSRMYLETQAPVLLFHNQYQVDIFREFSPKPCASMGAPFVYYRWMNGVRVAADAAGTIAFPSHSSHHVKTGFDWRSYCRDLKGIPARFQPITVCLYWKDILDGRHRIFMDEGFAVVCAGHMYDERFVERFYGILSRHRFITSNEVRTACMYGLEMGLPFFLWGSQDFGLYNTGGDADLPAGEFRRQDLAGLYVLTPAVLADLQAKGIPAGILDRLSGLVGKKVLKKETFRNILAGNGITGASHLDLIVERAQAPKDLDSREELFREPRETITAEQKAYSHALLGLNSARPREELRELLWTAFDTMVAGGSGTRLVQVCRKEADGPTASPAAWGACPACGSAAQNHAEAPTDDGNGGYPAAVGRFMLCSGCGTAFRGTFRPYPDREALGPERAGAKVQGGWWRLADLEEATDPLARLRAVGGTPGLALLVPSLGGKGMEACRLNAEARILFSITGLHRLMERAGYRIRSAFQDQEGMIRLVAERASEGDGCRNAIAPVDALKRSRGLLAGAAPEGLSASETETLGRIIALAGSRTLSKLESGVCLGKLLDVVRSHPGIAEPFRAVARLYLAWGDFAAAGFWLGLYSEMVSAAGFPHQELAELHRGIGLPESVLIGLVAEPSGCGPEAAAPLPEGGQEDRIVEILELLGDERFGEALVIAEAGLLGDRENPDLLYARAIALRNMERVPEAVASLERLLAVHPRHQGADRLLSRLVPGRSTP